MKPIAVLSAGFGWSTRSVRWIWLLWTLMVTLPALLMNASQSPRAAHARIVARAFGEEAVPFLAAAPAPTLTYLLAASLLGPLAICVLAYDLRNALHRSDSRTASLQVVGQLVTRWVGLYCVGAALSALAVLARSGDATLAWSWATRATLLGVIAGLPYIGLALLARALMQRTRAFVGMCGALLAALALGGLLAKSRGQELPLPSTLTAQAFSGRSAHTLTASLGLILWLLAACLLTAVLLEWRRRRATGRSYA
ncbi:MAG TPA: hypothetical protein VK524_11885 [Polyangiaceae bacterium]|nr:hypothetical protein [Polyangiaceae bacterium]